MESSRKKINHFYMGSRGFLSIWIMGSQNIMGLDYGSNSSEPFGFQP